LCQAGPNSKNSVAFFKNTTATSIYTFTLQTPFVTTLKYALHYRSIKILYVDCGSILQSERPAAGGHRREHNQGL